MIYGSICSGIEAATVAWEPLGWRPAFFAETARFPSAVLHHHYPTVHNLGDIHGFATWPDANLDILVGGTPCQGFSVAGLRAGLHDPRGNLTRIYLEVAARFRPRWVLWENVPGVRSRCDDGSWPLGAFLRGLVELGYGFAYRSLDAQYAGLAQRRQRVFVVGSSRGWASAAAVLFDRESLQGNPAPSRQAREDVAPTVAAGSHGRGPGQTADDVEGLIAGALNSNDGGADDNDAERHRLVPELSGAIGARDRKGQNTSVNQGPPLIVHRLRAGGFDASEDGIGRGVPLIHDAIAFDTTQVTSHENRSQPGPGRPVHTLSGKAHAPAVAFAELADPIAANQARTYTREGTHNFRISNVAHSAVGVRRLTPRECERLQGFPDDYTLIPYRGKPAKDGPRYEALGNSMAVPEIRWIGERIAAVDEILKP